MFYEKLITVSGCRMFCGGVFAQQEFSVPMIVTDDTLNSQNIAIGFNANGTDCYDDGLDQYAPPKGPLGTFWAGFISCNDQFFVDVRDNVANVEKTFVLDFQATDAGPLVVRWDPADLAGRGTFTMVDNVTGDLFGPVDMTTVDSLDTDNALLSAGIRILVTLGATGIEDRQDPATLAKDFVFYPNYPNPFNGETQFSFTVSRMIDLDLVIYNLAGQRVAIVASGSFAPGTHSASWNGLDQGGLPVSTGVYYGVLRSALQQDVKKLLYVK